MKQVKFDMRTTKAFYPQKTSNNNKKKQLHQIRKVPGIDFSKNFEFWPFWLKNFKTIFLPFFFNFEPLCCCNVLQKIKKVSRFDY